MEVVAGYTIINDVSARDWQWRTPTFCSGSPSTPMRRAGPNWSRWTSWVTRATSGIGHGSTTISAELDHGRPDLRLCRQIEYLTTAFPLEPGTVIATGTPAGVGAGFDPPRFLAHGDVVRIDIEGIGSLVNPVRQGPEPVPVGLE